MTSLKQTLVRQQKKNLKIFHFVKRFTLRNHYNPIIWVQSNFVTILCVCVLTLETFRILRL
jgi:hypothetical protein